MKKYLYLNFSILIAFIAFFLRANKIDFSGFSLDEMVSLNIAENFDFLYLISDNHPPIHAIVTKLWIAVFGLNETMARLPSAIFSAGTTIAIGVTALKFIGNKWISLICMLLHALFPLSILHAQLVRPYALFELTSSIQFFYYLSYLQDKTKLKNLLYASLLVALSSYLAGLMFVFEYIFQQRKKNITLILGANALLVVAIIFSRELVNWHYLDWQLIKYNLESLAFLPIELIKAYNYYSLVSGLGLTILFIQFVRSLSTEQINQFYKTTTITLSFIISFITFSLITKRAIFSERYFIFLAPVFFYFIAVLINKQFEDKRKKWLSISAISLIVIGSFFGIQRKIPDSHPHWKEAAMTISLFPSSIVLTTSTLALNTPYFKYRNISVETMNSEEALGNQIYLLLETFQNVWVVDTYWNKLIHFPNLNTIAAKAELNITDYSIFDEKSDAVVALRISR